MAIGFDRLISTFWPYGALHLALLDRLLVSAARQVGATLVTRDERLLGVRPKAG
jgi:predicted nucleic acid-binding protein